VAEATQLERRASSLRADVCALSEILFSAADEPDPTSRAALPPAVARLSPLGWKHINLTGDYVWSPLRPAPDPALMAVPLSAYADQRSVSLFLAK
jgi:hypothetical protein